MKRLQRIGFVNVNTLYKLDSDDISRAETKFTSITQQLKKKKVGLCGLAEVRWAGTGMGAFAAAPGWQAIYSGNEKGGSRGVALAMDADWTAALISHVCHNDRLLSARFQGAAGLTISVVVAYSPTDVDSNAARSRFYDEQLAAVLNSLPSRDVLFLLGDFNGQVGQMVGEWAAVRGQHTVQTGQAPSANGMRLLELAAAHGLVVANTLFPHKHIHTFTHVPFASNGQRRVIDYILASKRFRSSLRDWLAEATDAPHEVAEAMLAHVTDGAVVRAYRRTDFLEQRRALAERWADHVTGGPGDVVKLAAVG